MSKNKRIKELLATLNDTQGELDILTKLSNELTVIFCSNYPAQEKVNKAMFLITGAKMESEGFRIERLLTT
jgi:hypothetical protein